MATKCSATDETYKGHTIHYLEWSGWYSICVGLRIACSRRLPSLEAARAWIDANG